MTRVIALLAALVMITGARAQAQPAALRADSPAARPVPETRVEQEYPADIVAAGRVSFASQCGFCHGLDAAGGSSGPDLTRSELVASDVRGDLIALIVRSGRPGAEVPMPAFPGIGNADLDAIVAFVHDQKSRAEAAEGGRRTVVTEDVLSGNVRAGERYFERNCADCHSPERDLAGIASRVEGLALMQRMLNPRPDGRGSSRATPSVVVTTEAGNVVAGTLAYQDEFSIALIDADGRYRSFSAASVDYEIANPLQRHLQLLDTYTDEDMHDVLTYLHTLR